ncbi:MAG: DNA-directed RNA polymerase subunit beta, partial [Clostridiales bacterium]|nr:DNA-directed RNA polymerase subunit beta [Clostridiales bacterium]
DDVVGRVKAYEAIVKGNSIPTPGIPESFKVLIKELQALSLDIKVWGDNKEQIIIREFEEDDQPMPRVQAQEEETAAAIPANIEELSIDALNLAMDDLALADEIDQDEEDGAEGIRTGSLVEDADEDDTDLDDDLELDFDDDDLEIE